MNPWIESLAAALLAGGGFFLGRWFSRLPKPWWLAGYFIPLLLMFGFALARRVPTLSFEPPLSWMMMGRNQYAVIGFSVAMVLSTPLSRLTSRRDQIAVCIFILVGVAQGSVWPFLAPAFNRHFLATLQTRIDSDGVCLQSTQFNCGPAAAVTALRRVGLHADEGPLAIQAHTSSGTGTPPDILARTLAQQFGKDGLTAEYRAFRSLEELRAAGLTLAILKFSLWLDHYVTVLEVTDSHVVVGDPMTGLLRLSHEEFKSRWRFVGIVVRRTR